MGQRQKTKPNETDQFQRKVCKAAITKCDARGGVLSLRLSAILIGINIDPRIVNFSATNKDSFAVSTSANKEPTNKELIVLTTYIFYAYKDIS